MSGRRIGQGHGLFRRHIDQHPAALHLCVEQLCRFVEFPNVTDCDDLRRIALQEIPLVDKDADPQIGTLLRVDLPDAPGEQFLKVQCGTGRSFALPVPPTMATALDANAWTYNIGPQQLRKLEVRT